MSHRHFRHLLLLLLAIALPAALPAQPANGSSRTAVFRIGYIRQDPESITTSGVYQRMREFLLARPEITASMAANGVEDILLQSFDTHRLLIEAMDAEQLDLAFCSVVDFSYQQGRYDPVYQLRRRGDPHSSTGDRRVWHSGTIFVNNRSPLFKMETSAAVAALPQYVMTHEMAMVGSSSAAGYVYPYLALDRLTTTVPVINARSVFWDSSNEVVKAVINGIHDVGACDSQSIDEVLSAHGLLSKKNLLVKEILRTDPVPRDPIALHERWSQPAPTGTATTANLGRDLTRGIAQFFRITPGLPTLERTSREPFNEVSENLQRFRQKRQAAGGPTTPGT